MVEATLLVALTGQRCCQHPHDGQAIPRLMQRLVGACGGAVAAHLYFVLGLLLERVRENQLASSLAMQWNRCALLWVQLDVGGLRSQQSVHLTALQRAPEYPYHL